MDRYGTDRPDLRFDLSFEEITDILRNTEYIVFRKIIEKGGIIKGFIIRDHADRLSKNLLQNEYALKIVPSLGARGMTWMKLIDGRLDSNIVQFFRADERKRIIERFRATDGDVLMMIADIQRDTVNKVLGRLRLHLAERVGLIPADTFSPLWVTDFPLFELKEGELSSQHHPFTMPDRTDIDPGDPEDLLKLNSRAYDLVVNGEELGGGSIRIHDMNLQRKIFRALGLSMREAGRKFGFFLKALEYGAPPHGGLALGMDRVVAMILKTSSIRDVISFPKNRSAFCPLTKAPAQADEVQLNELGLAIPSDARGDKGMVGEANGAQPIEKVPQRYERITKEEVRHIAELARLTLSETEAETYRKDLNAVLNYVDLLGEVDTHGIRPMSHVLDIKNVWREDRPAGEKQSGRILANAPDREEDYFKVPKILEG